MQILVSQQSSDELAGAYLIVIAKMVNADSLCNNSGWLLLLQSFTHLSLGVMQRLSIFEYDELILQ